MEEDSVHRLACIMVGLPARGKTFIAQKVCRYLNWLGYETAVFNVGNYRRVLAGAEQPHEFFDHHRHEFTAIRHQAAQQAMQDLLNWLDNGEKASTQVDLGDHQVPTSNATIRVAIYDATNSTVERRQWIRNQLETHSTPVQVLFIESICSDPQIVADNIRQVKLCSPDYAHTQPDEAVEDFTERIKHYEEAYEPLAGILDESSYSYQKMVHFPLYSSSTGGVGAALNPRVVDTPPGSPGAWRREERQLSFVKMINVGTQVIINQIRGYLQSRIVYYLMNLHIHPRKILMCRHGESMFNVQGKIGGDADLSPRGQQFAQLLPAYVEKLIGPISSTSPLTVWTSTLKRTIQTSEKLPYPKLQWKALDEIDAGVCDGLTYEDIEERYPEDFAERDKDKYHYRYRGGESYKDLVLRLEPIIMELERQQNILIIGHQAVLRAIYAYFLNMPLNQLPYIHIPLHTIIQLTPKPYGCDEHLEKVPVDAVDTHRPKPPHGKRNSYGENAIMTPPSNQVTMDLLNKT